MMSECRNGSIMHFTMPKTERSFSCTQKNCSEAEYFLFSVRQSSCVLKANISLKVENI